jgi:hypothetical protein
MGLVISRLHHGALAAVRLVLVQSPQKPPGGILNVIHGRSPRA